MLLVSEVEYLGMKYVELSFGDEEVLKATWTSEEWKESEDIRRLKAILQC